MKYLFALLLTLSFSSCQKFLDKKSSTGITVPKTLADLQSLLDASQTMNRQVTPSIGEASADDYFVSATTYNSRDELLKDLYKWVPNPNDDYPNDWSYNYKPVFNANYCLEMIDKISQTGENKSQWENIKGSALFFRAYYFLQLAWTYCLAYDENTEANDLGIALRLASDFNEPSSRASVLETYKQIIADAKSSAMYLPDFATHPFRPSKIAAYGLLARTYLSMRNYDSAAKYAEYCVDLKSDLMDYNNDPQINSAATGTTNPFSLFNKEIIFYSEASLTAGSLIGSTNGLIDTILYRSYASNDKRKRLFFANATGGFQRFRGNYTVNTRMFSGLATNEILLISAEANARIGNLSKSMQRLNQLLTKRYDATFIPLNESNKDVATELILKERRKELLMRGLRFSDVKRLNKENNKIVMKRIIDTDTTSLNPNDPRFALPLPREVIAQSGMPQNPY